MRLDKLVEFSVGHPFGYHCEVSIAHGYSQEREHVRMVESFPHYNLFVEHLCNCGQFLTFGKHLVVTHFGNNTGVAYKEWSQSLDCDLATLIFDHPHVNVITSVRWTF